MSLGKSICDTLKVSQNLHLQKCDNLSILWLKGTPTERARAHGKLMGHDFTNDNLDLFVGLSTRGLDPQSFKYKVMNQGIQYLVDWSNKGAPQSYMDETSAMAEAMDIEASHLRRAIALPDIAAYSWALLSRQGKNLPSQGCTSALFTDTEGRFLYGRNLDFPGSPPFDQNPLLVVHWPEDGSKELKHVAVGTHGLQFAGITGFNEAGLTFSVHQNYTRLLSIKGVPMPYVGELVLRSARNLDEAVEIIRKNRPGPLWTFFLTDTKTSEALTVEVSNTHFNIRRKEGSTFAQTNHLFKKEMIEDLSLMEAGTATNSALRYDKSMSEMKTWTKPTAQKMAELLGWQKDRKAFSPISDVLKSLTIHTVIYERENSKSAKNFYVTIDRSPSPTGRWAQFKWDDFFTQFSLSGKSVQIVDFHHLPADIRARQTQLADIYAVEIMRHYPEAVEKLIAFNDASEVKSPDLYLALSALQGKLKNHKDSLVTAQRGIRISTKETPALIHQGLKWMEIVNLWHLNKKEMVLAKALGLWNEGVKDPELSRQVKQILEKKSPSDSSLSPGFDFFGGYLQGMPSRATP